MSNKRASEVGAGAVDTKGGQDGNCTLQEDPEISSLGEGAEMRKLSKRKPCSSELRFQGFV